MGMRFYVMQMARDATGRGVFRTVVGARTRTQAFYRAAKRYAEVMGVPSSTHLHIATLKALRTEEEADDYLAGWEAGMRVREAMKRSRCVAMGVEGAFTIEHELTPGSWVLSDALDATRQRDNNEHNKDDE